jgi:hypothetical protein
VPDQRSRARAAVAGAPWRLKLAAKLVLARLPVEYGTWSRMTLFKHGTMDEPDYAEGVFRRHLERVSPPAGFTVLELGPGDTAFTAVVARALGAERSLLVDVGPFARRDVEPYRELARRLARRGLPAPDLEGAETFDDLLEGCSATYLTGGLASLQALDAGFVDLSFSHAVLEHVRAAELPAVLRELRRIASPDGGSSHVIDLQDHLAHALNNLRFSERVWESRLFASSGFYTNRLRRSQLLELFADAGFDAEVVDEARWEQPPTPRARLAEPFRSAAEDDLLVHNLEVVLRPNHAT